MSQQSNRRTWTIASQAEILRSHQRDDDFIHTLRDKLEGLLQNFNGFQSYIQFFKSDIPVRLLYFIFTSGMGNQTLGEEYTGIVQTNLKSRQIPTLLARIFAAVMECLGERALLKMLGKLHISINDPQTQLTPSARIFLDHTISKLRTLIPTMILIHKGLFYIYGRYYSLARRIVNIDYAKVNSNYPVSGVSWGLQLLGAATLVQCFLKIFQSKNNGEVTQSVILDENAMSPQCQLCLESLSTTATPCGHLFCWTCIGDWLHSTPRCPLCREYVSSSRIIHLMNL